MAWLLDTGATGQISPDSSILTDYQPFETPQHMIVANGDKVPILGEGTAEVHLPNGNTFRLFHVMHVPAAQRYLISHSSLYADGLDLHV